MMDRFNELILLACTLEEEKATQDKIEENAVVLDEYLKKVSDIKYAEITTFRDMNMEINPVDIPFDSSVSSRRSSIDGTGQGMQNRIFLDLKLI